MVIELSKYMLIRSNIAELVTYVVVVVVVVVVVAPGRTDHPAPSPDVCMSQVLGLDAYQT